MTYTINDSQASHLNAISAASTSLRKAARDLQQRATEIVERADAGHMMTGFDSDILGQPGREVQHYVSVRDALVRVHMEIPEELIVRAMTASGRYSMPYHFRAGDQPDEL